MMGLGTWKNSLNKDMRAARARVCCSTSGITYLVTLAVDLSVAAAAFRNLLPLLQCLLVIKFIHYRSDRRSGFQLLKGNVYGKYLTRPPDLLFNGIIWPEHGDLFL